jgi:carbon monoxide dehydrogenase subunit G
MHFEGTTVIRAPRDAVYEFLLDPERVGPCGPGVESIEVIDATHYRATAKVGIGFISARFQVTLEITDQEPPSRAVVKGHGQAPGTAVDGTAEMRLSEEDATTTRMDWQAEVTIHGAIAGVGARLIEGTANKMVGQSFDCIRARLEEAPADETSESDEPREGTAG